MSTKALPHTEEDDHKEAQRCCWSQDVLRLLLEGGTMEARAQQGSWCGFCRYGIAEGFHPSVRCSCCDRSFHRECVILAGEVPGGFECGFCSPQTVAVSASDPIRCILCDEPPHTAEGQSAPLLGPFRASYGSSSRAVYVHPQCAWWSNQFPWSELAASPSALKCAGCGKGNASIRCTGCVGTKDALGHCRFSNCRRRYHYPCAAAAGLLPPGLLPSDFLCSTDQSAHFPVITAAKGPCDRISEHQESGSPSAKKRRRGLLDKGSESEWEDLRRRLAERESECEALKAHYAKARADRAELVERLELMANRGQEAQDRIDQLEGELDAFRTRESELDTLALELQLAGKRESALQEQLSLMQDQSEERECQFAELQLACDELRESHRDTSARLSQHQDEQAQLIAEAQRLQREAQEEAKQLELKNERAQSELTELRLSLSALEEQHKALLVEYHATQARALSEPSVSLPLQNTAGCDEPSHAARPDELACSDEPADRQGDSSLPVLVEPIDKATIEDTSKPPLRAEMVRFLAEWQAIEQSRARETEKAAALLLRMEEYLHGDSPIATGHESVLESGSSAADEHHQQVLQPIESECTLGGDALLPDDAESVEKQSTPTEPIAPPGPTSEENNQGESQHQTVSTAASGGEHEGCEPVITSESSNQEFQAIVPASNDQEEGTPAKATATAKRRRRGGAKRRKGRA